MKCTLYFHLYWKLRCFWRNLHCWQKILHCRRQWRHWQISPPLALKTTALESAEASYLCSGLYKLVLKKLSIEKMSSAEKLWKYCFWGRAHHSCQNRLARDAKTQQECQSNLNQGLVQKNFSSPVYFCLTNCMQIGCCLYSTNCVAPRPSRGESTNALLLRIGH